MRTIDSAYYEGEIGEGESIISSQAWVTNLNKGKPSGVKYLSVTVGGVDLHLPIEGLVDSEAELARLAKEQDKVESDLVRVRQKLTNPMFVDKAKPEIVERERELAESLESKLKKIIERKGLFGG